MFDESQIKAWRTLTASADLKEKVIQAAGAVPEKPRTPLRAWATLAACAAIVLCASAFGYSHRAFSVETSEPVSVSIEGVPIVARQAPQPVVKDFELDANRKTEASVSEGTLTLYSSDCEILSQASSLTAKGEGLLRWTVNDPDTAKSYTLRLKSGLKTKTVTLAYDPLSESWTADLK